MLCMLKHVIIIPPVCHHVITYVHNNKHLILKVYLVIYVMLFFMRSNN